MGDRIFLGEAADGTCSGCHGETAVRLLIGRVLVRKLKGTFPLSARSRATLLQGCEMTNFRPSRDGVVNVVSFPSTTQADRAAPPLLRCLAATLSLSPMPMPRLSPT
jgi:hypothetical protein